MLNSMRAIVMITGVLLIVIAGILFGRVQPGDGFGPWSAVALGATGLAAFVVGLFMPSGRLMKPGSSVGMDPDIADGLLYEPHTDDSH